MDGLRVKMWTTTIGAFAVLAWAGCQDLPIPGADDLGLGTTSATDKATDEAKVFGMLSAMVQPDEPTADEPASDEATYFGEESEFYGEVPPEAVDLPEEVALAEAEPPGGGPPVPHGRLTGRFLNDWPDSTSDESGGVFRGRWFSANDEVQGALRGEYHPLPPDHLPDGLAGGGVFRGKYIDLEGHFRGFLRGHYGHAPDGRGQFYGRWFDRHHRLMGILMGHWNDDPATDGGTFAGRWAAFDICAEADSLPEVQFDEGDFGGLDASDEVLETGEPMDPSEPGIQDEPDLRNNAVPPCIDPDLPYGFLRGRHMPYPPPEDGIALPDDGTVPPDDGTVPPDGVRPPPRPGIDGPGPRPGQLGPPPRPNTEDRPPVIRPGGRFRGRWRDHTGSVVGHLKGHYEPVMQAMPDGEPIDEQASEDVTPPPHRARVMGVFYGKYVDTTGRFRGFLRGRYGRGFHGLGVFRGHYYDADGQEMGVLRGRWANDPHKPGGPFFGFWNGQNLADDNVTVEE